MVTWKKKIYLWKNISTTQCRGKNTTNYLFHNHYLVLPELPHLRKMQGKLQLTCLGKLLCPDMRCSHRSRCWVHLELQLMQKGEGMQHHAGKQESLPSGLLMSSSPQRHSWKLPHGVCRPCFSHSWLARPSFGTQGPGAGGSSGAMQWPLCSRKNVKVWHGEVLTAVSCSVSQDLLLSFH